MSQLISIGAMEVSVIKIHDDYEQWVSDKLSHMTHIKVATTIQFKLIVSMSLSSLTFYFFKIRSKLNF